VRKYEGEQVTKREGGICWATDIHLDHADDRRRRAFYEQVAAARPQVLLVSGDISTAGRMPGHLRELHDSVPCPVLFVLGNHDFYGASIVRGRQMVGILTERMPRLTYLTQAGVVVLSPEICVVGHDGWADGRFGDYARSMVLLSDYGLIQDFIPLGKRERLTRMQQLAEEAAKHLRQVLPEACRRGRRILVVTHVPPFAEACRYQGRPSDADWLPHFSSKVVGDVLLEFADQHADIRVVVLCGHTHGSAHVQPRPNLTVFAAEAEYGRPAVARAGDWLEEDSAG